LNDRPWADTAKALLNASLNLENYALHPVLKAKSAGFPGVRISAGLSREFDPVGDATHLIG
jgi:hypothetical protein